MDTFRAVILSLVWYIEIECSGKFQFIDGSKILTLKAEVLASDRASYKAFKTKILTPNIEVLANDKASYKTFILASWIY